MAESGKAFIDIDVREGDGVYLIIDNPENGPRATRKEVLELIESYGVQDIDFVMITSVFKREDQHIEECISYNPNVVRTPETIVIEISKDKMSATIMFTSPINKGARVTLGDILKAIDDQGIKFGVPNDLPAQLAAYREPNEIYTLATGRASEDGINGYLEYHFDEKKKTYKPKENEDGKVDYKNLDLIELASKGQVLVTVHNAVPGSDGINVLGKVASARAARPAPPLVAGKNVMVSEDGLQLIATEDGQILFEGKKVSISPLLEIRGNVDNSTGNIDFNGSIVVRGNVLTGFTVSAVGNIEVLGVVEGAKILSDHSIILYSGIQGNGVAEIIAGESITTKYAENCTLVSEGDIVSDSIMHSTVTCGGSLLLRGRNGLLVGGRTRVMGRVEAISIGSVMATSTELEVGMDPKRLQEFRDLQTEFARVKSEYDQHNRLFLTLNAALKKGILPVDKKVLMLKTISIRTRLREEAETIQERIKDILPYLENEGDVVIALKVIHPGVKVQLGNAAMHVHHAIERCKLKNLDGKVEVLPVH